MINAFLRAKSSCGAFLSSCYLWLVSRPLKAVLIVALGSLCFLDAGPARAQVAGDGLPLDDGLAELRRIWTLRSHDERG